MRTPRALTLPLPIWGEPGSRLLHPPDPQPGDPGQSRGGDGPEEEVTHGKEPPPPAPGVTPPPNEGLGGPDPSAGTAVSPSLSPSWLCPHHCPHPSRVPILAMSPSQLLQCVPVPVALLCPHPSIPGPQKPRHW